MKKPRLLGAVCACIACISTSVNASYTYSYMGNAYTFVGGSEKTIANPYDTTMSVSINIELASELRANFSGSVSPLSYTVFDGVNTLTNTSAIEFSTFEFSTDGIGLIDGWTVQVTTGNPSSVGEVQYSISSQAADPLGSVSGSTIDIGRILYCNSLSSPGVCDLGTKTDHLATNGENRGVWSVIPLPPAVWLFGSGLIGLIGLARRKA